MAVTRLMPIHASGKSIAAIIEQRTDYVKNADKTDNGELISSFQCVPETVSMDFLMSKNKYANVRDESGRNIIAYHIRQSFKPGEVTPELANKIGYELAVRFTHGKHAFIVCTHTDKAHIHNHCIFNSTTVDSTRKFKNFWGSSFAVRRLSDRLCIENGLSVIENPGTRGKNYGAWYDGEKPLTWSDKLRQTIDAVLEQKPADIGDFIMAMQAAGYETKQGKYMSFRAAGQKKFTRLRSLGAHYTDDAILERIQGKIIVPKAADTKESAVLQNAPQINLLIDIQNSIKAQNSPGYEHWAKIFNLKESARTLMFLQENKLTEYQKLEEKTSEAATLFDSLCVQIKQKQTRLDEIAALQKHIGTYGKTRDIYVEYRKSGYNKKFYAEHESEINLHKTAKQYFDGLGLQKLPSIKELQTEYAATLAEKKKSYSQYKEAKENMRSLCNAKSNVDKLLNYSSGKEKGSLNR